MWQWFNNNLLKMTWLNDFFGYILNACHISIETRLGSSLQFFLFDVVKIFILLSVLIFLMGIIQSYFPPERTQKILGKIRGIKGNILGALLGTVTPFCSCSSIPIFIGFTTAGLPLGVTFSFLISSPMVDIASIILLMSFFGIKIATLYVLIGLILAIIGGTIIDHAHMEYQIQDYILDIQAQQVEIEIPTWKERIQQGIQQVKDIVGRVWPYVIIGVGIGALIHNWIPETLIQNILGNKNPFSVILAVLVGIPMYADIFGVLPIAEALFDKGVPIGTLVAFMMSVTTLSLPSLVMLKKVVKSKLLWTFIGICVIGILIIGFLFNIISVS